MSAAAAAPSSAPTRRLPQVGKDLLAGTCSGVASILVCHPLDTVRVRMQTAEAGRFKGVGDVFASTIRNEGVRGLYKGMSAPLLSQGIQKATMFFVFGGATRFFQRRANPNPQPGAKYVPPYSVPPLCMFVSDPSCSVLVVDRIDRFCCRFGT